jgi:hypothetical protein
MMVDPTRHVKDTIRVFRVQRDTTPVEDLQQLEPGSSPASKTDSESITEFWGDVLLGVRMCCG